MNIIIYPSYIYFSKLSEDEEVKLKKMYSIRQTGYYFSPLYKKGLWDGYVNFYKEKKRILPIGFLDMLYRHFEVNIDADKRNRNLYYDYNENFKIPFRDYQLYSVLIALMKKHGILCLATNAGKTLVFVALSMILKRNNVLILTHRQLIYDTILAKFKDYIGNIEIGQISSDINNPRNDITVAMVQSLSNKVDNLMDWYNTVNVILIDECHNIAGKTFIDLMKKSRAYMRIGFSGTITDDTLKRYSIIQYLGDIIYEMKNEELINLGISAKPIIKIVKLKSSKISSYKESIKDNVIYNTERILKICKLVEDRKDKKILIITDLIVQGRILSKILDRIKIKNTFLYSDIDDKAEKLAKFKAGKINLLIATNLVDEGMDIADIDAVILAFPRKSYRQILQRIGRGLRISEGKTEVEIFDFSEEEDYYLKRHFKVRMDYYIDEKFECMEEDVAYESKKVEQARSKIIEAECIREIQHSRTNSGQNTIGN